MAVTSIQLKTLWTLSRTLNPERPEGGLYRHIGDYSQKISRSNLLVFVESNKDLLRFIDRYSELKALLVGRDVAKREDLVEVIAERAAERLGEGSPITKDLLKDDPTLAMFIAGNIGGLARILRSDRTLAQAIATGQRPEEGAVITHIVKKVSSLAGRDSPLTEDFLQDHPEAAIYLLLHPYTLSTLKEDQTLARRFVAEAGRNAPTYNREIAKKAKELVDMPTLFSTTFFERNQAFARMVVASALNGEPLKLPSFIRTNPELTSRHFSQKDLIEAYERRIAQERFPPDFPLDGGFFARNRSLVIAVIGSDEFVENLKGSEALLKDLFGEKGGGISGELFGILLKAFSQKGPSGIIDIYI